MVFHAAMRRQNRAPASVKERCYAWLVMTGDKIQSQVVCGATGINRQIAFIAAQEGHGVVKCLMIWPASCGNQAGTEGMRKQTQTGKGVIKRSSALKLNEPTDPDHE